MSAGWRCLLAGHIDMCLKLDPCSWQNSTLRSLALHHSRWLAGVPIRRRRDDRTTGRCQIDRWVPLRAVF